MTEVKILNRNEIQTRASQAGFSAIRNTENPDEMYIEGYFAKYDCETELWPGAFEEIARGAFNETLSNDIRALIEHNPHYILGRNKAKTLELRSDHIGLWGRIHINPKDQEAVNLYARVERGDVSQASFGFNVLEEETEHREEGSIKWKITKIDLHEVSVVSFPAYRDTELSARHTQAESIKKRRLKADKVKIKTRLEDIKKWR